MANPNPAYRFGGAGPGRPKGLPNKTTALLKDAILRAAAQAGDEIEADGGLEAYLKAQAISNPGPFMSLLGKVLPTQVNGTLTLVSQEDALAELDGRPDETPHERPEALN